MELTLSRDDPKNTILTTPDGHPWYHVNTPSKFFKSPDTTIMNVNSGEPTTANMGTIEWHNLHACVLKVGSRRVQIHQSGKFTV